ncbi:MAG: hypothetical protein K6B44_07315 [Lachnospiraceae bacterium]|nr:hypothetical protein [Lachnospiraceae bacterium]
MILFDARRVKAYEYLKQLCEACGKSEEFTEGLWMEMIADEGLMGEFMYYLDNHSLFGQLECKGYTLNDLYFYNMRQFEMTQDIGKNYSDCDKEALVLDTFMDMAGMLKDPDRYIKKLSEGLGMDLMM